jgi:hypothetical protein
MFSPLIYRLLRFLYLPAIFILIFSVQSMGQQLFDWRSRVDQIIEQTDSLSLRSQRTFSLNRVQKVDRTFKNDIPFKETWSYTVNGGKVVLFQVHYVIDTLEYTEAYYVNNDRLICMEEYESSFFSNDDQVKWGKVLFFHNNSLKLFVKVGKAREDELYAKAGYEVLSNFDKRYTELKRYLK